MIPLVSVRLYVHNRLVVGHVNAVYEVKTIVLSSAASLLPHVARGGRSPHYPPASVRQPRQWPPPPLPPLPPLWTLPPPLDLPPQTTPPQYSTQPLHITQLQASYFHLHCTSSTFSLDLLQWGSCHCTVGCWPWVWGTPWRLWLVPLRAGPSGQVCSRWMLARVTSDVCPQVPVRLWRDLQWLSLLSC